MSKIIVVGESVVITSDVKMEDIKLIQANNAKAANLYETNEDGKKTCIFTVGATEGRGNVSENGIVFNGVSNSGDGKACITVAVPAGEGPIKDRVAAAYGKAVMRLNELEPKLAPVVEAIKAEKAKMLEGIQII